MEKHNSIMSCTPKMPLTMMGNNKVPFRGIDFEIFLIKARNKKVPIISYHRLSSIYLEILHIMAYAKNSYIDTDSNIFPAMIGNNKIPMMAHPYIAQTTADIPRCPNNDRKYRNP